MATKYARNEEGEAIGTITKDLGLVKPLGNEHYDINIFNANMDKISAGMTEAQQGINSKAPLVHTHQMKDIIGLTLEWSGITGKPNFHRVATSGSYDDLTNKPVPSSSTNSTSTTVFANSNAVKLAYDKAVEALNKANTIQQEVGTNKVALIASYNELLNLIKEDE